MRDGNGGLRPAVFLPSVLYSLTKAGESNPSIMSVEVNKLVEAAGHSANAGRWAEAEALWEKVLKLEPGHPQALCSLGIHALQRGDAGKGYELLCAARERAPKDFVLLMSLVNACQQRNDAAGEREAIDAALAIDPYFLPALMARAAWFERFGTRAAAAATYANALKIAPPEAHWPDTLRPQLEHGRKLVDDRARSLGAHLAEQLAPLQAALPSDRAARWREAIAIRAGRSRPYHSDSNQLCVPRLPAIPFFDRTDFPALDAVEEKTSVIRDELLAALESDRERFNPYVAYRPGEPVNQWQELNHSSRWSAFHLWRGGKPVRENLERCPETAQALGDAGMVEIEGLCPNAMFSALAPKTRIPPHNGETNARLVAHLPLIVPDGCRFRVGFEEREWRVGEILVFDDTIEHEAHNDSNELRVILIFDVWNPLLQPEERKLVNALAKATREFKD